MMIHRKCWTGCSTLAEFIRWDHDPYMVITDAGDWCGSWMAT